MKNFTITLACLILCILGDAAYAGGFKRFSYGNPPPSPVFNANARPVIQTQQQTPGNPATCSVGWSSSNYQSYLSDLQQLGLPAPSAISLICSAVVNGQTYSNSVAIPANHNGAISVSTPTLPSGSAMLSTTIQDTGGSVLYAQAQSAPSAIPEVIGAILTNPNLVGASLDLTLTDLNGVLDSSTTIDADILNNLSALNAEIDEADHGCTLDGGASATAAQGRDYLICVMEAHYGDTLQAAIASFTAPSSTELVTCNGSNLCGPAPAICAEAVWVCSIVPNSIPATGTLTHDLSGPQTEPVNFGGIDIAQSLSTASYSINIQLSTYANPVQATSFTYSNLALPSDVYLAPQSSTTGLADASIVPLVDTQIETSNGFSFVNAQNSVTYSATLSDGTALPSWLSIDSATGMLSGVPPIVGTSNMVVAVTATDAFSAATTVNQSLSLSTAVTSAQQPLYQNPQATQGTEAISLYTWSDPRSGVTLPGRATSPPDGSRIAFLYTGTNSSSNRLSLSQIATTLNVHSDYQSGGTNLSGITDVNGNLITISSSSSDTGGYYLIALNARDGYGNHGLMQLAPLPAAYGTTSATAGTEAGGTYSLYVASKPFGVTPDLASDLTGAVAITGSAISGQTVTADISGLNDPDGFNLLGSNDISGVVYQWYADGTPINSATSSSYTLTGSDVGTNITVTASYTDSAYFGESATGTISTQISAPASNVAGSVVVTGTVEEYETLTADATGVSDSDGLGTLSYQWLADGNSIDGETSATLTLSQDHVGQQISVSVSYTDTLGTLESVTSSQSVAVVDIIYQDQPTNIAFNPGGSTGFTFETGDETANIPTPQNIVQGSTITYTSNSPSVCTVSGTTLRGVSTGNCSLTATIETDGYYSTTKTDSVIPVQVRYCMLVSANQGANCPSGYSWATETQAFTYSFYSGSEGHRCGYMTLSNDDVTSYWSGVSSVNILNLYASDSNKTFDGNDGATWTNIGNVNGQALYSYMGSVYSPSYSGEAVLQEAVTTWNARQIGRDVCVSNLSNNNGALAITYGAGISTTEPVVMSNNTSQYLTAADGVAPYQWQVVLTDSTYVDEISNSGWSQLTTSSTNLYAGAIGSDGTQYCGHNPVSTKLSVTDTRGTNVTGRLDMCGFGGGSDFSSATIVARGAFGLAPADTDETFYFKVKVRDSEGTIYVIKRNYRFTN